GVDGLIVAQEGEGEIIFVGAARGFGGLHEALAGFSDDSGLGVAGGDFAAHLVDHLWGGLDAEADFVAGVEADALFFAGGGVDLGFHEIGDDAEEGDAQADEDTEVDAASTSTAVAVAVAHELLL